MWGDRVYVLAWLMLQAYENYSFEELRYVGTECMC